MYSLGMLPPTTLFSIDDALAAFLRHHVDVDLAELTATARLLGELAFAFAGLGDGFAIGDLRRTGVGLDVELAAHAVHDDVEVKFAHAGDDRLAGFLVGLDREGGIFLDQAAEGFAHLFAIGLGLRLDGHGDNGLREGRRLELDVEIFDTKRVARLDVLDADDGGDVARVNGIEFVALVGLDLDEAADAVALVRAGIVDRWCPCSACRNRRGRRRACRRRDRSRA